MLAKRKIYVAGPMSGYKDYNFPAFLAASKKLREDGWEVFCPAEEDIKEYGSLEKVEEHFKLDPKKNYRERLFVDIEFIMFDADAIALLPGWGKSRGVAAELAVAKALDLEVMEL